MTLQRRRFLQITASAAALSALPRGAAARAYPTRPVRIIVGYPAGGGNDIIARLIGQRLSEGLGQQFIIENRPGAASNIATEAVVRSSPDGYTLACLDGAAAINSTLYDNLTFNVIRDIAPVASLMRAASGLVVHPSVPAKTVPEFIAYAKANPGKINMASGGIGTPGHVAGELFKLMAGVSLTHVPYRGLAPALTDLFGGQVQVLFSAITSSIEYIRAGRLRILAVTSATRHEDLPDVATVGEFLPGYEASNWYGLGAPKDTPVEIIGKLNNQTNIALTDPKLKTRIAELGGTVSLGSSADFRKTHRRRNREVEKGHPSGQYQAGMRRALFSQVAYGHKATSSAASPSGLSTARCAAAGGALHHGPGNSARSATACRVRSGCGGAPEGQRQDRAVRSSKRSPHGVKLNAGSSQPRGRPGFAAAPPGLGAAYALT
jgi:tripartite-type tricarboxylate transporter receptor subunit TctC